MEIYLPAVIADSLIRRGCLCVSQDEQGQPKTQHPDATKSVYWESPDAEADAFNAETGWFQAVPGEEDEKKAGS